MSFGITTRNGVSLGLGATPSLAKVPPYATLRLNFAQANALDSILTFTRASSQTYFDSTGTLQTATTNVAAFDYDPTTLVPLGLSLWEARTNNFTQSGALDNAAWVDNGTSRPGGNVTDPAGGSAGVNVLANGAASSHFISGGGGAAAATATSIFVKAGTQSLVQLAVGGTAVPYVNYDLVNKTATPFGTGTTAAIQALPNGWFRISMVTTDALSTGLRLYFITSTAAARGESSSLSTNLYLYGAQQEAGAFATPYIATTAAAATRAAPVCSTTNLGWYTQNIGTWVVAARSAIVSSGANQMMARTSDNSYNNQIAVSLSSTGFAALSTASGGVFDGLATAVAAITANTSFKAAGAFAANDLALSFNSAAVVTDSALTAPASQTVFNVGSDHAGANHYNGWIASLTYYPLRLPNATLQALST